MCGASPSGSMDQTAVLHRDPERIQTTNLHTDLTFHPGHIGAAKNAVPELHSLQIHQLSVRCDFF